MNRIPALLSSSLFLALFAAPAHARLIITEVAWMGSDTDANHEWVEIYNAGLEAECDLSAFVLVGAATGAAAVALPAVPLAAGDFYIVQRTAGVPVADAARSVVVSLNLTNGGEALRLCPAASPDDLLACDVVNAGAAWFAGTNEVPKQTMTRNSTTDATTANAWSSASATPLTATFAATPGDVSSCEQPDAGFPDADAGVDPDPDAGTDPVDAGPNTAPSVSVTTPATDASTASGPVTVTYAVTDDDGDGVDVTLQAVSTATADAAAVTIAEHLPAAGTALVDGESLFPGRYQLRVVARDSRGLTSSSQAPGAVEVVRVRGTVRLKITEPDGVNDIDDSGFVTVAWQADYDTAASATLSLFVTDAKRTDGGTPIAAAIALHDGDADRVVWDARAQAPGEYFVYGVLSQGGAEARAVSDASVVISAGGCGGCSGQGVPAKTEMAVCFLFLGVLAILPRARPSASRR